MLGSSPASKIEHFISANALQQASFNYRTLNFVSSSVVYLREFGAVAFLIWGNERLFYRSFFSCNFLNEVRLKSSENVSNG